MSVTRRGEPGSRLHTWGVRGWMVTGIGLGAAVITTLLAQVGGLIVPLVVASVVGALFAPLIDVLARRGLPRSIGGLLVIVLLAGIVGISLWLVIVGIAEQGRQISTALGAGLTSVEGWLAERGYTFGAGSLQDQLAELVSGLIGGAGAYLPGLLSGTVSAAFGIAIGTFLVYYILIDWHDLTAWVARNLGLDETTGVGIVEDAIGAVRRYFTSLSLSAVVTAVLIGVAAWVMDIPLAFTIAVITLVTSYIPYLGAIVSGAFATLVTLGSAGLETAVVMLVIVLIVQNIVQTIILTRLTSTALHLHPIVTLGSTIVGATLAGALGAMLSSPIVAVWLLVLRRLRTRDAALAAAAEQAVAQSTTAQNKTAENKTAQKRQTSGT